MESGSFSPLSRSKDQMKLIRWGTGEIRVVDRVSVQQVLWDISLLYASAETSGIRGYVPWGKTSPYWAPITGFRSGKPRKTVRFWGLKNTLNTSPVCQNKACFGLKRGTLWHFKLQFVLPNVLPVWWDFCSKKGRYRGRFFRWRSKKRGFSLEYGGSCAKAGGDLHLYSVDICIKQL